MSTICFARGDYRASRRASTGWSQSSPWSGTSASDLTINYTPCIVLIVLGRELRIIREKLRLTQAEIADRLGVSPNTVARWERDEVRITPPMEKLIRLISKMKSKPEGRR